MRWLRYFIIGSLSSMVFISSIIFTETASLKAFYKPPLFEFTRKPSEVDVKQEKNNLHIETNAAPLTEVQFSKRDILRLDEKTNVDIVFTTNGIKVLLMSGNIWASRLHGDPQITVQVGDITVFPAKGSGSFRSEGQQIQASSAPLFAAKGESSEIPTFILFPFESSKGGKLMENDIEGRPCGPVGCKNFHPWTQKNEKLDQLLLEKKKEDFKSSIEDRGANFLNIPGFFFRAKDFELTLRSLFSVRSGAEQAGINNFASMLLEDVFYFSSINDQRGADARFSLASSILAHMQDKKSNTDFWNDQYRSIAWISPDDALASFRDAFRYEVMKLNDKEKYLLALESLGDLFRALEAKDKPTFLADFKKYEAEIDNFFPGKQPDGFYRLHTKLFGHLSQKYPDMALSGAFLETVSFFEHRALDQESGQEKQDDIVNFISSKIELMKKVSKRLLKNEMLETHRDVMLELAKEIDALAVLLPVGAEARMAKENYFAEESSILSFLASNQLTDDDDFIVLYRKFVEQREENRKIETLLYGSAPDTPEDNPQYEEIIKKDFEDIGLAVYELIIPAASAEWYGVRNASFQNISFKAGYSPRRKAFRNIVVEERLYPFAIPIEKFKAFLLGATASGEDSSVNAKPVPEAEDESKESRFEKLLKTRVIEKIGDLGIKIGADGISIIDAEKAIISVNGLELRPKGANSDAIIVSFIFQNTSDEVLELRVTTPINEILVKDTFSYLELEERARLIYERAKLEQNRLEEEANREAETSTAP